MDPYSQGKAGVELTTEDGSPPSMSDEADYRRGKEDAAGTYSLGTYEHPDLTAVKESAAELQQAMNEAPIKTAVVMVLVGMVIFPIAAAVLVGIIGSILVPQAAATLALGAGAIVFALGTLYTVVTVGVYVLIRIAPFVIPLAILGFLIGAMINSSSLLGLGIGALAGVIVYVVHNAARRFTNSRNTALALDGLVVVGFLAVALVFGPKATAFALHGTFTLNASSSSGIPGRECHATGGNADFAIGYPVSLKRLDGTLVATTALSSSTTNSSGQCVFSFEFKPYPTNAGPLPWVVDVGHHGSTQVIGADFSDADVLELYLGGS